MTEAEKQEALATLREREGLVVADCPEPDGWLRMVCILPESERPLLQTLFREQIFWCDLLVSVSGSHHPGPEERVRVHYHLESLIRGWKFAVTMERSVIAGEKPVFPGFSDLWKAAEWHERETAELFGVEFEGHPYPRRLLLPADWEGYPLRKDYQPADSYHGIKIRYAREDSMDEAPTGKQVQQPDK